VLAGTGADKKSAEAEVEGVRYKVVWSCLLLVEMLMTNMACGAHFPSLSTNVVGKIAELLRMFNSRTTQLVLGAGAIHAAARLKSINAKHLALVTQCLGMILAIFPHVRAVLMAQLPAKQHTLLSDIDRIKKDYMEHNEKVLNKFVSIIGGIVEQGLAPRLAGTDFDVRAKTTVKDNGLSCCVFLEGVSSNVRKMHQVLHPLLPPDHLQDVFSRIFAYLDQRIPAIFIQADAARPANNEKNGKNAGDSGFQFPKTDEGKLRLLTEAQTTTDTINALESVRAWDFTLTRVLERKLDFDLRPSGAVFGQVNGASPTNDQPSSSSPTDDQSATTPNDTATSPTNDRPSSSSPTDDQSATTPNDTATMKNKSNEVPESDENGPNTTPNAEQ
jgi:vacuolar protein sorting-associated protein 54